MSLCDAKTKNTCYHYFSYINLNPYIETSPVKLHTYSISQPNLHIMTIIFTRCDNQSYTSCQLCKQICCTHYDQQDMIRLC